MNGSVAYVSGLPATVKSSGFSVRCTKQYQIYLAMSAAMVSEAVIAGSLIAPMALTFIIGALICWTSLGQSRTRVGPVGQRERMRSDDPDVV